MRSATSPPSPPDAPSAAAAGTASLSLPVPLVWSGELEAIARAARPWIWDGYLAPGSVTLLTSQWKWGKTTLLALLLARRKSGGVLAGRAVAAGKTVVVSEEAPSRWGERGRKLDFGGQVAFLCRPFDRKPTAEQWQALVDRLVELHREHGIDLVVIDSLATFLPGHNESHAGLMLEALLPLQRLTALGVAVLLLHHPRKGETLPGQAARGSGALAGYVDILIEMDCCRPGDPEDRRRRLRSYSRHERL